MIYRLRFAPEKSSRSAFSLIEMMAVMFLLGVLLSVVSVTILSIFKVQQADSSAFERQLVQATLADQFRADVAGARSASLGWDAFDPSDASLVLGKTDGGQVVYRWHEQRLQRTETRGKKKRVQTLPLGDEDLAVEFARSEGGLVSLRLKPAGSKGQQKLPGRPPLEIAAALGGDYR